MMAFIDQEANEKAEEIDAKVKHNACNLSSIFHVYYKLDILFMLILNSWYICIVIILIEIINSSNSSNSSNLYIFNLCIYYII